MCARVQEASRLLWVEWMINTIGRSAESTDAVGVPGIDSAELTRMRDLRAGCLTGLMS